MAGLPGLRHYLLIEPTAPQAELWTREAQGWHYELLDDLAGAIRLTAWGIEIPISAIYEDVAFPAAA